MLGVKLLSLTITGIIQAFFVGILLTKISGQRFDWKKIFVYGLIMGVADSLTRNIFSTYNFLIYLAVYIVIMLIVLRSVFKVLLFKGIALTGIVFFLQTAISLVCLLIVKLFFRNDFNTTNSTLAELLIIQILAMCIYVIVILFVYLAKMKINIPEDLSKRKSLEITINIVLSFFFISPNIFSILNGICIVSKGLFVYNSVALLAIISLNIFNAIKLTNMEVIKNDMEFQKIYIETLNNAIDSLRGFKHDYNNIVQSIGGYLMINDMDGLKSFYHHILAECKKVNNIFPLNNYIKECPPIYGILVSKMYYSESKDVLLEINVSSKINVSTIKLYDLSKILGILLDNAIEAAAESKKKYVEFSVNEPYGENKLVIEIMNSFDSAVNVEEIFRDGFTTKKEHTGFGLSEVKKILSKYKNCTLYTRISDNIFTHKIEVKY